MLILGENLVKYKNYDIIWLQGDVLYMPATVTHHFFTKDVYKNLSGKIRKRIDIDVFNLFGKSFDILFFSKKELGSYAHRNKVNSYFKNIIVYIKDNHLENNLQVLSYLYGSICHYVLDSTIHPYIYYHAGVYSKENKQYRGRHNYYEYMIDAILFKERYDKDIYRVDIAKDLFPKINFSLELQAAIDYAYFSTFNEKKAFKLIKTGKRNFKFMVKHGMCSRYGVKKFMFRFIDLFPISIRVTSANYHIKKLDYTVVNREHHTWNNPVDKKISYQYSFDDLYNMALEKAVSLISDLDKMIQGDAKELESVLKSIGNDSYATGISCTDDRPMKYFYDSK